MNAICVHKQRLWNLRPDLPDKCIHRVHDNDFIVWGAWNSFLFFLITYASVNSMLSRPAKRPNANWSERIIGLVVCLGTAYAVQKKDLFCLIDMHCTGKFTAGNYFSHITPVLVWLIVSGLTGWFLIELLSRLRNWVLNEGGLTTWKGLTLTVGKAGFWVVSAAATTLNARTGLLFRDLHGPFWSMASVVASVVTSPALVLLALQNLGKRYDRRQGAEGEKVRAEKVRHDDKADV